MSRVSVTFNVETDDLPAMLAYVNEAGWTVNPTDIASVVHAYVRLHVIESRPPLPSDFAGMEEAGAHLTLTEREAEEGWGQ